MPSQQSELTKQVRQPMFAAACFSFEPLRKVQVVLAVSCSQFPSLSPPSRSLSDVTNVAPRQTRDAMEWQMEQAAVNMETSRRLADLSLAVESEEARRAELTDAINAKRPTTKKTMVISAAFTTLLALEQTPTHADHA